MKAFELTGTYTYRSFVNREEIVDDFNKIQFAEAELTLFAASDGTVTGLLSWPTNDDDTERAYMDITGVIASAEPFLVQFDGKGRASSAIADYHYRYELTLARRWPETTDPHTCLVGSVIRVKDHGKAKAGVTASVAAVQRAFVEPHDIQGVALLPSTLTMLASKWHRLWHATWHTVRGAWWDLQPETRKAIDGYGWGLARPPFRPKAIGGLDLENGAGEDFLFMHRWMIKMVSDDYANQGVAPPQSWKQIPKPSSAQASFVEAKDASGLVTFKRDAASSGNMVPPADEWAKTQEFFNTIMRSWERQFSSKGTLASLSLGALGNLIEFTIHNNMHMRWATPARDPETGEITVDPETGDPGRPTFDFSDKWDSPKYDYLGEFYSSHVNPLFWRLHGWVDDRIDDWFTAQEAASPGRIKKRTLHGVEWFDVNEPFVMVPEPFVGVALEASHGGHMDHAGHPGHDPKADEVATMLKVMDLLKNDGKQDLLAMATRTREGARLRPISMHFRALDDIAK
ncbi:hypothetical protein [Rhodopseudomonas parapalustris]